MTPESRGELLTYSAFYNDLVTQFEIAEELPNLRFKHGRTLKANLGRQLNARLKVFSRTKLWDDLPAKGIP
jgi:hypothetical protein